MDAIRSADTHWSQESYLCREGFLEIDNIPLWPVARLQSAPGRVAATSAEDKPIEKTSVCENERPHSRRSRSESPVTVIDEEDQSQRAPRRTTSRRKAIDAILPLADRLDDTDHLSNIGVMTTHPLGYDARSST